MSDITVRTLHPFDRESVLGFISEDPRTIHEEWQELGPDAIWTRLLTSHDRVLVAVDGHEIVGLFSERIRDRDVSIAGDERAKAALRTAAGGLRDPEPVTHWIDGREVRSVYRAGDKDLTNKRLIVYLTGFMGEPEDLDASAIPLAEEGYATLSIAFPPILRGENVVGTLVRFHRTFRELLTGPRPMLLVCHSMSGLAAWAALTHPEQDNRPLPEAKVILLGAPVRLGGLARRLTSGTTAPITLCALTAAVCGATVLPGSRPWMARRTCADQMYVYRPDRGVVRRFGEGWRTLRSSLCGVWTIFGFARAIERLDLDAGVIDGATVKAVYGGDDTLVDLVACMRLVTPVLIGDRFALIAGGHMLEAPDALNAIVRQML